MFKGMITLWSGAVVDIPDDWALCDGGNSTPDLRNRFVVGAGDSYAPDDEGGAVNHNHTFTGDGHLHTHPLGPGLQAGNDHRVPSTTDPATGTTNSTDGRPPYYALAYIMKLHDDPDPRTHLPWPYAAKAIIEHTYFAEVLEIFITFRFSMNTDNKPADNLWLIKCNDVPEAIDSSAWLDPWTMLLTIDPLVGAPAEVTVEYDGPDELLATRWNKQWEPWAAIPSVEIPTAPETKTFSTGPAQQNNVNVAGIDVLFLDCSANDITIGGFVGGVNGQVLHIAKLCPADQDVTLKHIAGTGNQDLYLHAGGDETLRGEYGGWALACNGSNWYDMSHAKHV